MAPRFGYRGRDTVDSRRNVMPDLPTTLPHDIRKEISWVDYSNPVNPLGTPKQYTQAFHANSPSGRI